MAGITRATAQLFATTGLTPTGGFGAGANGVVTTEAGSSNTLSNIQTGQSGSWAAGWLAATLGSTKFPAIEDMNSVDNYLTTQIAYLLERGIPEYDAGTTYNIGDVTRPVGGFPLYTSLTNANTGNALSNGTYWAAASRIVLSANTNFYVATTGNDSNAGTSGSPWLTIQHAINYIQSSIDLAGYTATINVATGTYTTPVSVTGQFTGEGSVAILGNTSTPSNCIISTTSAACITVINSSLVVGGLQLQTATSGNCLQAATLGAINVTGAMIFGACAGNHVAATNGGNININTNYTISGAAQYHYFLNQVANLNCNNETITLTGTPAFSGAFAFASANSALVAETITFSGSATGVRYAANLNGTINTNSGGANYFPGSSSGTTSTGGQYA